jgi:hypothetical protein
MAVLGAQTDKHTRNPEEALYFSLHDMSANLLVIKGRSQSLEVTLGMLQLDNMDPWARDPVVVWGPGYVNTILILSHFEEASACLPSSKRGKWPPASFFRPRHLLPPPLRLTHSPLLS